jgi:PEP-CTERM motif
MFTRICKAQAATSLEQRLDAYTAQAKAGAAASSQPPAGAWPRYAAATGAGLALATAAGAGIIYTHPATPVTVQVPAGNSGRTARFQFGGQAGSQFGLFATHFQSASLRAAVVALQGRHSTDAVMVNHSGSVKRLHSGAVISNGAGSFARGTIVVRAGSTFQGSMHTFGTWPFSQTGFAGVKFQLSDGTHFGWIRLHPSGEGGFPTRLEAIDWAWNTTPNQAIRAGQGVIPEPTSLALMLLASGAAGVLAWRRRRQTTPPGDVANP